MKTELLTFQTTVRVTYDPSKPEARPFAVATAKRLFNNLSCFNGGGGDLGAIAVTPKRSVYQPKGKA